MGKKKAALNAQILALQTKFAEGIDGRLAEFENTVSNLKSTIDKKASLKHLLELMSLAHKLSGTSGTFLFHETTRVGRAIEAECESILAGKAPVLAEQVERLNELLAALRTAVSNDRRTSFAEGTPRNNRRNPGQSDKSVTILLVEDDHIQASVLQLQLANLGFHVKTIPNPAEIEKIDFNLPTSPSLVLMDIMIGQDRDAGLRSVRELRATGKLNIPVIFLTARDDFNARIEAVRGGADGYMVKPINIIELVETIKRLTDVQDTSPFDVLLVGAAPDMVTTFESMLKDTNMACRSIADGEGVLEALKDRAPEVILMNTVFPNNTGIELATMIRQFNTVIVRIPIVFFSDKAPEKNHLLDLRANGDDLLVLPVDPNLFVLSLSSRCKRTRVVREIIEQRRESDQRFHAISESVVDAIITTNSHNRIIYWNNGAAQMFGYEANDMIGTHIERILPTRHRDEFLSSGFGASNNNQHVPARESIEMYGLTRDENEFPIELTAAEWMSKDQSYMGYIIRDISERRKAEEALEQNRKALAEKTRILQTTLDSIDQGFVVWDETYHLVVHSQKCLDFWYNPPEEVVVSGAPMINLMRHLAEKGAFGSGNIDELAENRYQRLITGGETSSEEIAMHDDRTLDIHRFPLPEGGYVAKYTDITVQKNNEIELIKTANELKMILSTTFQGYWRIDNKAQTVEVNPRMAEMLGVSQNDAIGTSVYDYLSDEQKKLHKKRIENRLAGISETYELVLKSLSGKETPCIFSATPLTDEAGQIIGSFALVSDITELKQAQQTAETANRAKSEFLSSMSHELRTPMNAILGFGQMLDFNPKEPLTDSQKGCVEQIMKGGQHLLELINDVLDLAQIEAGKVEICIEDISPTIVIDECLSLIENLAGINGVKIFVPDTTVEAPKIRADHTRFKQVLLNLMSNAVKYNRKNGTISISIEKIAGKMLRIAVTDTGWGISEDKQNELFMPFSRLGAEMTEVEGSGIGLVVCKNLVELMNGSVGLESKVGKGSTFWVQLPLADPSVSEPDTDMGTDVTMIQDQGLLPGINGSLLYVEDNPANLKLMELIVDRIEGLSMLSCRSAELGIDMARAEKPDLIILDINLPGMNGIEALNELRKMDETKDIPVLALSAAATQQDIRKGIEVGFLRYLTKPIKIHEIVEAIKDAIETA